MTQSDNVNVFLLLVKQLKSREAKKIFALLFKQHYTQTRPQPGLKFDRKF